MTSRPAPSFHQQVPWRSAVDALIVLLVAVVAVLVFDALVLGFGQDSR
jgi:hypothetical protein